MNSFTSKAFGWLLLATLVSCGNNNSSNTTYAPLEESEVNPSTAMDNLDIEISTRRKVEFAPDFSNYTDFKQYINTYEIVLKTKTKALVNADINCKKHIYGQKQESVFGKFIGFPHETKLEMTINKEDPNNLQFSCEVSLNGVTLATYKDQLRKSFVVEGDKNWVHLLGNVSEIDTLAFDPGSRLISNGIDVNLKVNKLIAYNSLILTFPFESKDTTLDEHIGHSGGKIKIHAAESYGTLTIELRGLNGGKQIKKPVARDPLPRDPNLDGKCPSSVLEGEFTPADCTGKDGLQGHKGHSGFAGFKGGDSGSLDLTIKNNFLEFMVIYDPGLGSNGGEGGEGGLGSPGGRGNTVHIRIDKGGPVCPRCRIEASDSKTKKFPNGKDGAKGDQGDPGPKGQDGLLQESNLVIGNVKETINSFWKNN